MRSALTGVLNTFVTVRTFCQSDKPAGRSLRISTSVCVLCVGVCACLWIPRRKFSNSSPLCWSQLLQYVAQIGGLSQSVKALSMRQTELCFSVCE